ncbi:DUF2067 family protein [Thermocladium modestius]|nr:DUF2067 family protein [Thermocladium modestius]
MGRRAVLKFKSSEDAITYVDLLTRRIKVGELIIDVKSNVVELRVRGGREAGDIMMAEALKIYGALKARNGGSLDLSVLITMAQPPHPVPFDVVTTALNLRGFPSELSGMKLRTKAPLDLVISIIKSTSSLYAEMARMNITQNAKKIIATHALLRGLDVPGAIQELMEKGAVRENESSGSALITASSSFEDYVSTIRRGKGIAR